MSIPKQWLSEAAEAGLISKDQVEALAEFLAHKSASTPRFQLTHVLYYLGGLLATGAMTLFMTLGWEAFGGVGIVAAALVYAALGLWLCERLAAKQLRIPAGICAGFVVSLTPLWIYGLQQALGLWPEHGGDYRDYHRYIQWYWIWMELGTLFVGALMLWRYRYPFLVMPIAVTLWYMSMDVAALIYHDTLSWQQRGEVSLISGLCMLTLAFYVDIKNTRYAEHGDYAFWLYLFGVIAFWGGLSSQHSDSELGKLLYCLINLVMIVLGVLLRRRVFTVFGALGCYGYLGYLSYQVFAESWLFPVALTALGFGLIYLGILWQRHEPTLRNRLLAYIPPTLRQRY